MKVTDFMNEIDYSKQICEDRRTQKKMKDKGEQITKGLVSMEGKVNFDLPIETDYEKEYPYTEEPIGHVGLRPMMADG